MSILENEVSAPDILSFFETVFGNDVRFRIIYILSKREGAGLREIARNASISHKNLSNYLEVLMQKGIVESHTIGFRDQIYRLSTKYNFLRWFL